ncbi:MAG: AAA family ATPase [Myxococcota bacterium]
MFIRVLHVEDVRSFDQASLTCSVPEPNTETISNVTLLLGNNGTGKTTLLTSVAIACLGPALEDSGFVPYYQVRRDKAGPITSDVGKAIFDRPRTSGVRARTSSS